MENGSIADAVIANRGLNFATPSYGYGSYGHRDGSVPNANILSHAEEVRANGIKESINGANAERSLNDTIVRGNEFLTDRINQNFFSDRFSGLERLMFANQADIDRKLSAMDLKQTECCCEIKAAVAAVEAKLDSQVVADQAATIARQQMELTIINQNRASA